MWRLTGNVAVVALVAAVCQGQGSDVGNSVPIAKLVRTLAPKTLDRVEDQDTVLKARDQDIVLPVCTPGSLPKTSTMYGVNCVTT